jgi:hypothetical protein
LDAQGRRARRTKRATGSVAFGLAATAGIGDIVSARGEARREASDDPSEAGVGSELVFPHDEDRPFVASELSAEALVSRHVSGDLGLPPGVQVCLEVVARLAAMPKTTVHEHDAPPADEDEVRTPRESPAGAGAVSVRGQVAEP